MPAATRPALQLSTDADREHKIATETTADRRFALKNVPAFRYELSLARGNSRLFNSQTTDQYGKYDLHGLAPGSYTIFAWTGIEQGRWEDAEFLRPQEDRGESVELREEEVKTLNLKLIEKKSEIER